MGWIVTLSVASFRDLLFALALGIAGELALFAVGRRSTLARAIQRVLLGFLTLCVAYGVVSVGVFEYFQRPLSYDLLRLVSDATAMRSSISERITTGLAIGLISLPIGFLVLTRSGRWRRTVTNTALVAAGFWIALGWWQSSSDLGKMKFSELRQNRTWSCSARLLPV